MLSLRLIEDRDRLQELAPVWNELLSRSGSNCVFLTWEWISTWLEIYGAELEPLVLVADEGDGPCGIAPLMIRRGASPVAQLSRTLMFIGQEVDVTPDYLDFIVPRGLEPRVTPRFLRELAEGLRRRWDFIDLAAHLETSPHRPYLLDVLARAGVPLRVVAGDVAPYAELPRSFESFLEGKSAGFRKQHRNKVNRLQRAGKVRYLLGGDDLPVAEALEHLVRLNRRRWQEQGASFRSERYLRFHQRLCERLAPRGWLALLLMELDGEIVAGRYDYVYDGKLWCYQGGWSPEHHQLNLGDNMIAAIMEWGIARGLREYDFLGGEAVYKERWATGVRRLGELRGVNQTGRAQLLSLLREGRDLLGRELPARAATGLRSLGRRLRGDRPLPPPAPAAR